ncbi:hypothetical protein MNBD_BACTEROID05-1316 [hydrothermal vent metagenome]|uniref:Four helix bundle protein n=1 Tax=hydrothermal vent metagenome TaxID=652676 RepID=A0A3B0T3V3_9ZZZZ
MQASKVFFDFERLDVYQKSLNFTNKVFEISSSFRREIQYSIGDQFRRAALSVCNNIAEGSRKTGKSKNQFYGYALDSDRECIPMISISLTQGQIESIQEDYLRKECVSITKMLYRLINSIKY